MRGRVIIIRPDYAIDAVTQTPPKNPRDKVSSRMDTEHPMRDMAHEQYVQHRGQL